MLNLKNGIIQSGLLLVINVTQLYGQEANPSPIKRNSVYAELLGSAWAYYNIGYERIVLARGKDKVAAALGAQFLPENGTRDSDIFSLSPQVNYLHGRLNHLEVGMGAVLNPAELDKNVILVPRLGYRYQRPDGGVSFKAAFTPIINGVTLFGGTYPIFPWGGIAFGWTF